MLICSRIPKMISCGEADVLTRLYCSRGEEFIGLNGHQFGVRLDDANGSELVWEEIVLDWAETEFGL